MRRAHGRVVKVYERHGLDVFVTSREEGNHSPGSFHYDSGAEDIKRQEVQKYEITNELGPDYDVVEYSDDRDIYHIEYDPKG